MTTTIERNTMKYSSKIAGAAVVMAVSVLMLTGCGAATNTTEEYTAANLQVTEVVTPEGVAVECVVYREGYAGGVSCDWEGARR